MLNACIAHLDEKHTCPHCQTLLTCCNTPPIHVGDGLGWGTEYIYICLNDECPLFVNGWKFIEEQYGHSGSYRYMIVAGEKSGSAMMVGSPEAFKGCTVDVESLKLQNKRYAREKEAMAQLDTCVADKNLEPLLTLLLDEGAHIDSRTKACGLLAELSDLACIDPLRNHKIANEGLQAAVNLAIGQILKANFKKECPYCAEVIKAQAKVCMHCSKDL